MGQRRENRELQLNMKLVDGERRLERRNLGQREELSEKITLGN
jgi:hypothetical protein